MAPFCLACFTLYKIIQNGRKEMVLLLETTRPFKVPQVSGSAVHKLIDPSFPDILHDRKQGPVGWYSGAPHDALKETRLFYSLAKLVKDKGRLFSMKKQLRPRKDQKFG